MSVRPLMPALVAVTLLAASITAPLAQNTIAPGGSPAAPVAQADDDDDGFDLGWLGLLGLIGLAGLRGRRRDTTTNVR